MNRIGFNNQTIVRISNDELVCRDNNGYVRTISFGACRKNWVDFVNTSKDFDATELTEDETRCIGWRDAFGHPPYIELFSEPRIRFEFSSKKSILELLLRRPASGWRAKFLDLQTQLIRAGWSTFDLG